jgi:hypothetical protein
MSDVRREIMMTKKARVVVASVLVGALCLTTDAFARGGGGGHGGAVATSVVAVISAAVISAECILAAVTLAQLP